MSTMTELHVDSQTSAALLFESDVAKEEALEFSLKEEEMVDSFASTTVKAESSELDMSRSTSVEAKMEYTSLKSTPSATPPVSSKTKGKPPKAPVQLIGDLPRAEEEAMKTFVELPDNHYQYSTLGKSRESFEGMLCDCQYEHGVDDLGTACGHNSDCINRLTQVECLPEDCRCGAYCQNQRFQRKQYANLEIVKTEMKGFGLRAGKDIPKDGFIYEYVGDVVSQPSLYKRMRLYAEEGIRHFYFMALQRDEFIDATKRGGIGRFANHSCNPNCYVERWTVGNRVRMGIFASRLIKHNEELTFNYNVDRYGHDAQPCYCGEPNCVGFIGGKTQTDLAGMDDLYLDALGISEEVEKFGLKGSKKKKGKKLDEDFIPDLKPIVLKDVPKVVQAMRQTQSRKVLVKLLTRIKLTEELACLRQVMRLRGFSVITNILDDYNNDVEVQTLAMECMCTWPLIQRNKVEDSKVAEPVKLCAQSENETVSALAKKLLALWESLEYAYRIPKRVKGEGQDVSEPIVIYHDEDLRPSKRSRPEDDDFADFKLSLARPKSPKHESMPMPVFLPDPQQEMRARRAAEARRQHDVAAIIAAAAAAAEADAKKPKPEEKPSSRGMTDKERADRESKRLARKKAAAAKKSKQLSKEEREANKEKRLLKLIGAVVVKCMSKYKDQMDHDLFKKYAKELTQTIAEKEKKSASYKEGRLETLSEEKTTKIKKFAKDYIAKILRKLEKSGQRRKPSSTAASSSTPDGKAGADDSFITAQTVADVMDLDMNDNYQDEDDHMEDDGDEEDRGSGSGSPEGGGSGETSPTVVADPRIRHRASSASKDDDLSWDGDLQKPLSSSWSAVPVGS
ncbi:hypothetical protein C2E23DRAFT_824133 [Lenzites betulinus]|nr:hypothetical protein C2E23DRAFT_824133 [Lenzites betulinus]